jgi:hypothetical protein
MEVEIIRHMQKIEAELNDKFAKNDPLDINRIQKLQMHLGMILSNEPTLESLIQRHLAVSNATLHKTFAKTAKLEEELNDLVNSNDLNSAAKIRDLKEVLNLKEKEHLERELQFKEYFTLLEDVKPTKTLLNLESTKGGYNEITTLQELNTNCDPNKEESNDNIKYNVFNDQPIKSLIIYKKQPTLKTTCNTDRFNKIPTIR